MSNLENIFLIGPMGAGKSTIGRHLAERLKKEFWDCDLEIEHRTGVNIPVIFDIEGEAGFRKRETSMIEELTRKSNIVLATGGGVILSEENRKMLRSRGTVVYLRAALDTLVKRTHRDRNRPLLQGVDNRERLEALMEEREPLYTQEADLIVDTDNRPPSAVAQEIAKRIKSQRPHENT